MQFLGLQIGDKIPDDNRLYADSAYRSDKIESYLWLKKCKSFVHEKAYRSKPLTYTQERANSIKSKIRVLVLSSKLQTSEISRKFFSLSSQPISLSASKNASFVAIRGS